MARIVQLHMDGGIYFNEKPVVSTCVFFCLTGEKCPFCGISRSIVALMHGKFRVSMLYHPLGLHFVVLIIAYATAVVITSYKGEKPIIERTIFRRICLSIMLVSLIIWLSKLFNNVNY